MDASSDATRSRTASDSGSSVSSSLSVGTASTADASSVASAAATGGAGTASSAASTATPDQIKEAEGFKERGNAMFTSGKYTHAVDLYTQALELYPTAPVYCNRAMANLKVEAYGSAIADATAALALDASFVKGYYRRGSALLALQRYKDARADFRAVLARKPTEKEAATKLEECEKAIRRKAFEDAITHEGSAPPSERLTPDTYHVEPSYKGPHLPPVPEIGAAFASPEQCAADESAVNAHGITLGFVKAMIEEFKAQKTIHRKYVQQLLIRLKKRVLAPLPSLVRVAHPEGAKHFNVCGDTHGQYFDTLNIFELNGFPSPTNPYLFNGDFVDRGSFSCENVITLFALKLLYPDHVHLTRGNHETKNMNKMYGFEGEVKAKYDQATMDLFAEVFCALPLAAVVNNGKGEPRVFVVHGGLFQRDGVTLDEIAKIPRFNEPPESGLMSDILWSDPQPFAGRGPSKRGVGQSFGPDVTAKFLETNGLSLVIRSHEVMEEGYQHIHHGKLITVFSAPNYCDQMGNKGAVVRLDKDCSPSFLQFDSVPHPPVKPMQYAGGISSMFGL